MRRCSLLTLSILLLALWLSDASHRDSSSIPRSNQRTPISTEHRRYPPWNASPNIDDDGFLVMQYSRLPGEWESEFRIRKRHKKEVRTPANIRQVPGDGNVSMQWFPSKHSQSRCSNASALSLSLSLSLHTHSVYFTQSAHPM
jgi:hypothetical protein